MLFRSTPAWYPNPMAYHPRMYTHPHICTGLMAIFLCYSLRVDCTVLYLVNNMLSICLPSRVHQVTAYLFQCSCLTHCQEFIRSPPIYFCIHVLALPIPLALLLTLPCSLSLAPACSPPSQLLSLSACHQGFTLSRVHWVTTYLFWCSCLLALTLYISHSPSLYLGPSCSLTLLIFPASIPFAHCQGFVGSLVIFQDFLSKVCRSSSIFLCFIC